MRLHSRSRGGGMLLCLLLTALMAVGPALPGPATAAPSGELRSLALVLPSSASSEPPRPTAHDVPSADASNASILYLAVHAPVATETPNFWTVDVDGMRNAANPTAAAMLNATPIKTLRYGDDWVDQ